MTKFTADRKCCSWCSETKPITAFYLVRKGSDSREAVCINCVRVRRRMYPKSRVMA